MNEWATAWTITPVILRCGAELAPSYTFRIVILTLLLLVCWY